MEKNPRNSYLSINFGNKNMEKNKKTVFEGLVMH